MEAVIGLLLMILGVSHGVETYCDGRQDGAQCYGALGGTVVVRLMDNASEIYRYYWLKKNTQLLDGRKNFIVTNLTGTRFSFTPSDGTFRINELSRTDGGEYTLETFDSDGTTSEPRTLQLTIQAPVSSVLLVPECLSQGEMMVSCSSEGGDSPQYSWTLDGRTLTDAELLSGNPKTNSVTLKQHVKGLLVCSVRNNVSSVSDGEEISTCGVETYCDGRQDGAQCYGALGGTVVVQLMDSASEIHRYQWLKNPTVILNGRKNTIASDLTGTRFSFTASDGTFRINKLSRTDGGEYKLQTFDSEGRRSEPRTLQLTVQAPVSSVLLVTECLSQGEMMVSCYTKGGDSPQYSWTLDGRTLTDAELLSGNPETNSVTLKQHVSGYLVCSVRNNVNSVSDGEKISTCGYIYINCTSPNGTHISQWVLAANNTLCIEPTTTLASTSSAGVETYCDGRQDGAQCYGALGGTVVVRLMDSASEIFRYQWLKKNTAILHGRKNLIVTNLIDNRSFFTPSNGTFRINELSRTDGGEYELETADPDGRGSERTLQLTIQGVETYCDGRQDGAQCYGALGGTVVVRLMDNASEIHKYLWLKKNTVILDGRKNTIVSNLTDNRFSFTPSNGTFRINKLSRTDGGEYKLQTFDSDGRRSENRTLQLTVQAPVSSVLLVTECLSQGEMKVSCSSKGGESPQYSWTLDGRTLTDAELLSGNPETNSVTLKQHVEGKLVCSVRNNVNRVSDVKVISTCGYIYINCTSENGTHISQWVFEANNTLCIEPTTTPTTTTNTETSSAGKETGITVSISPCTNNTSSNQTVTPPPRDDPWYINYWPIMAGVLSALVLLVAVGVAVIIRSQKKKQGGKAPEEDDQELTYADVNILQRPGRQVQQRAETEVEYGQIRFSERPRRQTVEPPADDCVYAMVRKDR
ncbi:immunoglobulin superfamily member 10-like isoform X2 [Sebastes fasciatus]|uniref:immunoglobulin superfamily member 10-like isoform X2 n=1 Tax=Sebastes fasciatus TaxID=394691 RepID=UPI003D9F8D6F